MNQKFNPKNDAVLQAWHNEISVASEKPWMAASEKPWMAALLMTRSRHIFERFNRVYRQLVALPRRMRRRVRKQSALTLAGLALMISLGRVPTTHAATIITVTPGASVFIANDGCSLAEAIVNANDDAATHPDCPAGNGADTIMLDGNTYTYTSALDQSSALPDITSEITIEGAGSIIERDGLSPQFRIMVVRSADGNLILNNATIRGGKAAPLTATGGILVVSAKLALNNSTISDNDGKAFGGGLGILGSSTVMISDSTITNNIAEIYGGGLSIGSSSQVTINNSVISDNYANDGGGVMNFGELTITNTTINNNDAALSCGGISTENILFLTNSTVSGNVANSGNGGGLCVSAGELAINNSTFTGNSAGANGGGIYDSLGGGKAANAVFGIVRSVVSGNSADGGGEVYSKGALNSDTNLFGRNDGGFDNSNAFNQFFVVSGSDMTATSDGNLPTALADILEATLADNGGPTFTHALVEGSPAIDVVAASKAPNATCTAGELDQRGAKRADGFNQGGSACDVGAYEYASTIETTAVALRTYDVEAEMSWLPTALSGILATAGAWLMRRKYR